MGAESWIYNYTPRPCSNCGTRRVGRMWDSRWYAVPRKVEAMVCSRACGRRLNMKYASGMLEPPESDEQYRVRALRVQIRLLRSRLRRAAAPPSEEVRP